jgi:hypothetical protein
MNKAVKTEWVAELRDETAQQTTGVLSNAEGDCCLGVLCKLAVKAGVIPEPEWVDDEDLGRVLEYGDAEGKSIIDLPPTVRDWAELPVSVKVPFDGEDEVEITIINDGGGRTFDKVGYKQIEAQPFPVIADIIEVTL